MKAEQLTEVRAIKAAKPSISIDDLTDKSDRTLIYGYDVDRVTIHVYIENERISYYRYSRSGEFMDFRNDERWHDPEYLVPNKRAYPEATDFEFATILARIGHPITFTTWGILRSQPNSEKYHGRTM